MARYQFISCHTLTRQQLDPSLNFSSASWSWVVGGNGTLTGKIAIPHDPAARERLRIATAKKSAAIYIRNSAGQYIWGGPVVNRSNERGELTVTAVEWRSWLYKVVLPPELDGTGDIQYSWEDVDQIQIARELVAYVTAGGTAEGCPAISMGAEPLSGKPRDLHLWGTALKSPGELIDSIANQDGGFEWGIESRVDGSDGLPRLYFVTYYPQRGNVLSEILFKTTTAGRGGGNITSLGAIEEDATSQVERFWATGVGAAPDQIYAQDTMPELASAGVLRFDGVGSFASVSNPSTLASHARRSRTYFSVGTNNITITHALSRPSVDSYAIGDRVRLIIEDSWNSYNLDRVRIVEKNVNVKEGIAQLTLDLTDFTLPEVDAGGGV